MLKSINEKLKQAMLMPRYILIIFGILGILILGLLGYFGYTTKTAKEENVEFLQVLINSENQYQEYFSENPELKENYLKWLEGKK